MSHVILANFVGSLPHCAGAWMFVLCVLCSKEKRQSQDDEDKETITFKV
jgi:hypothetical protein